MSPHSCFLWNLKILIEMDNFLCCSRYQVVALFSYNTESYLRHEKNEDIIHKNLNRENKNWICCGGLLLWLCFYIVHGNTEGKSEPTRPSPDQVTITPNDPLTLASENSTFALTIGMTLKNKRIKRHLPKRQKENTRLQCVLSTIQS